MEKMPAMIGGVKVAGILSYGAYIPYHRLERKKIGEAFGERALSGEKAVANFDEDSVSMGVNAALACLNGLSDSLKDSIGGLYFATTTAPYAEKLSAVTMAKAIGLREEIRTADLVDSWRASASAFLAALDLAQNSGKPTLSIASDCLTGAPQGTNEQLFGDAAATFLLGDGDSVVCEVKETFSYSKEQFGNWRSSTDKFAQSWEDRFVQKTYSETIQAAVQGLFRKSGLQSGDFRKLILAGPSPRSQMSLALSLGFTQEQIEDSLSDKVGLAGTAQAPLMLVRALEEAQPGDRILYVSFGEGSDALVLEVTEQITKLPRRKAVSDTLIQKSSQLRYTDYLKWRGILPTEPPRRPAIPRPSVPAMYRNYDQNLALSGSRCLECGTPQFPRQRVCAVCQAKDKMSAYSFYGIPVRIATYTVDYLAASPSPPTVIAVVDFEGGGRMMCELTDCDPKEVAIGMEVEMTFRRLYEVGSIHNYFWKATPKRQEGERA